MNQIAIFGFGSVGQQLAKLFHDAGKTIVIYSKDGQSGSDFYQSASFSDDLSGIDAVALAIPYTAVESVLSPLRDDLRGKIIIDCTNPLNEDWSPLPLGENNSAAEEIASSFPEATVIKAFNTIFADIMDKERHDRNGHAITAFIGGDDAKAKNEVMDLASASGFSALDVGPLKTARYLEAIAHLNIQIAIGQEGGTNAALIYHRG